MDKPVLNSKYFHTNTINLTILVGGGAGGISAISCDENFALLFASEVVRIHVGDFNSTGLIMMQ